MEYTGKPFDCMIGTRKWKSSVIIEKTLPEADWGTDHQLFLCKFQVRLKQEKKASQFPSYNFEHMPTSFKESTRNHFQILTLIDKELEELRDETKDFVDNEKEK